MYLFNIMLNLQKTYRLLLKKKISLKCWHIVKYIPLQNFPNMPLRFFIVCLNTYSHAFCLFNIITYYFANTRFIYFTVSQKNNTESYSYKYQFYCNCKNIYTLGKNNFNIISYSE